MGNALGTIGKKRLAKFEAVIETGFKSFMEVGLALGSIRDERLYRDTHDNFEDYLRQRWALSRARAYQLMAAAELSTAVDIDNERQARELAGLEPDEAAELVDEAKSQNNGRLTAPAIRKARQNKNTHIEGETGDEGSSAEGDVGLTTDDGAASHDDGRAEPEPVSPLPPVIDTTAREQTSEGHSVVDNSVDVCPFCKGTGRKWVQAS